MFKSIKGFSLSFSRRGERGEREDDKTDDTAVHAADSSGIGRKVAVSLVSIMASAVLAVMGWMFIEIKTTQAVLIPEAKEEMSGKCEELRGDIGESLTLMNRNVGNLQWNIRKLMESQDLEYEEVFTSENSHPVGTHKRSAL